MSPKNGDVALTKVAREIETVAAKIERERLRRGARLAQFKRVKTSENENE